MLSNLKLTDDVIAAIEKSVGMSYQEMVSTPATDIDRRIEEKYGIKLWYNDKEEDLHILSRGSVFIALRRYLYPKDKELTDREDAKLRELCC